MYNNAHLFSNQNKSSFVFQPKQESEIYEKENVEETKIEGH